jgi:hypothetical protein
VIVDRSDRLAALEASATLSFELGPLDRDEVTDYLRSKTTGLEPPLSSAELDGYAAASAADPSLLWALERVFSTLVVRSA